MTETTRYIAVDLGAESGRVVLATLADAGLSLREVHRFSNGPVAEGRTLRWDIQHIVHEALRGIGRAVHEAEGPVAGIGVDSWGVDFGLLDGDGDLVEAPYHYRDARTDGVMERAFELLPRRTIYEQTGTQFLQFNTLYQLLAMRLAGDAALDRARRLLFVADLVTYHLTGRAVAEYTLASTSQMMSIRTGQWSLPVLDALGLPSDILPEILRPGTVIGLLRSDLAAQVGVARLPVIAVGAHDTASAVAAVPAEGGEWGYLSSGTWSLLGVELNEPLINEDTYRRSVTNEGGVGGTIRLHTNIMGLWLVQECRRHWQAQGEDLSYAELTDLARDAAPFAADLDPSEQCFLAPGDMPDRINACLAASGQPPVSDKGAMVRAILEGLALVYRRHVGQLEEMLGHELDALHVVGGGSQNDLLNQFTADATGCAVIAGPVEATAIGNVLMQAIATGRIGSLGEGRAVVAASFPTRRFEPENTDVWQRLAERRGRS